MKPSRILDTAEALGHRLPPLMVEAERVALSILQGTHGRRAAGAGETFWQFRPYQAGDPPARINWRQSAKTDTLLLRENEWENIQTVWVWCDGSGSMGYRSGKAGPTKRERAQVLAVALAHLLIRGGERMGLLGAVTPASGGEQAVWQLAQGLLQGLLQQGVENDVPHLARVPVPFRANAHLVAFSDWMLPPEDIRAFLTPYAEAGAQLVLVQVLDPAETTFPFDGRVRLKSCEGGGTQVIQNAAEIRTAYLERLAHHQAALTALCKTLGCSVIQHTTDHPAEDALSAIYTALAPDHNPAGG